MTVQFFCPACERETVLPLPLPAGPWSCPGCGGSIDIFPKSGKGKGGPISRCFLCASERFYIQRDFNQRIGCLVAAVGAVLSPFTYGISLLVCLGIDLGLYLLLRDATVCYRCGAVYRGLARNPEHGAFDLHVADRVMEEIKYLDRDRK